MNWIVYVCCPIDFGWSRLRTVSETIYDLAAAALAPESEDPWDVDGVSVEQFLSDWGSAKEAAKGKGWEGDFRHEPCVFWVPVVNGVEYGFMFKQDNNGTSFIVSPRPLPGLDEVSWS